MSSTPRLACGCNVMLHGMAGKWVDSQPQRQPEKFDLAGPPWKSEWECEPWPTQEGSGPPRPVAAQWVQADTSRHTYQSTHMLRISGLPMDGHPPTDAACGEAFLSVNSPIRTRFRDTRRVRTQHEASSSRMTPPLGPTQQPAYLRAIFNSVEAIYQMGGCRSRKTHPCSRTSRLHASMP